MKPSDAASETPIHFTPLPSRRWAALFALSVDPGARAYLSALHIDEGSLPFRSSQSDRDQDDLGPQVVQTLNSRARSPCWRPAIKNGFVNVPQIAPWLAEY